MTNNPNIIEVTEQNFVSAVAENSSKVPVFLDFYATWCAPCQTLLPIISKLAEQYQGKFILAKINSDEQKNLASQFEIRSLPTVKIVRNEKTIDEFQGAKSESELRIIIEKHIEHEWNKLHNLSIEKVHQGEIENAITLLQQAYALQKNDLQIRIDLCTLYFQTGKISEANTIINDFSSLEKLDEKVINLLICIDYQTVVNESSSLDELTKEIIKHPDNLIARYQLCAHLILLNQYQQALDGLIELMKLEKNSTQQHGKQGLLNIFKILGNNNDLVKKYRNKMFSLLN